MQRQPPDPRYRPAPEEPTWRGIFAAYAVVAAFPVIFFVASHPLPSAVVLTTAVGLVAAARRTARLVRCFYDCEGIAFDLGGRVRITVAQTPIDDPK